VRIALEIKGIPYEYRAVHLIKDGGEQHTDAYRGLNPSRELPTLEIDGKVLAQSLSIIEYLEETRPGGFAPDGLLPGDAAKRAAVRRVSDMIASNIQPVQNLRVLQRIMGMFDDPANKQKHKISWGAHWIDAGFEALEAVLEKTAGVYCIGDSLTMADCCLVPQVYNARRFKLDMSKFPVISRIEAALVKLAPFERAKPGAMPDAQ
jgi:maleylacetoacetate isomerase